uniref:Uncharacterized protein n=1 Tax=Amphimedon queenslandica TaxID=400682 RepID=A0A1X7USK2_AMPQE
MTHLNGRFYHLPGGSIGRLYVDLPSTEISHLAAGNYLMMRNLMVRKGANIREVLEMHMKRWTNEDYDVLVDEAVLCDKTLHTHSYKIDDDHFVRVFSRHM